MKEKENKFSRVIILALFIISSAGLVFSAYGFFSSMIEEISSMNNVSESIIYVILLILSIISGLIINKRYKINIKEK